MPYTRRQITRLLRADLIDERQMPTLAGRVAETDIKRRLFRLEDRAVREQWALYRAALRDLQAEADRIVGYGEMTRKARPLVMTAWRGVIERLTEQVARISANATEAAYLGGYYGRAWLLDMQTRPDVAVSAPPPRVAERMTRMVEQGGEWAWDGDIWSLLGAEWKELFRLEMDDLLVRMDRALNAGIRAGEGMRPIMRRVAGEMGVEIDRRRGPVGSAQRAGYRANFNRVQTITRTYVMNASNQGAAEIFRQNGALLAGMRHLTARDERVCRTCQGLEGTLYALDEWAIPPSNTHPNCILPGNEVALPGELVGATKSFYDGPAIEITLSSGRRLTVAANHPILTPRGWVKAKVLTKGSDVISATNIERIVTTVNPDNDYRPSPIEDVFESLNKAPFMSTVSVPATAEDFYGDGRFINGDIDIVFPNRLLLSDREALVAEHVCESVFHRRGVGNGAFFALRPLDQIGLGALTTANGIMSSRSQGKAFSAGHALHADFVGLRDVAPIDTGFVKTAGEYGAGQSVLFGERLLRLAGEISLNDGIQVGDIYPAAAEFNATLGESEVEHFVADPYLAGKFSQRFAGEIAADKVVDVRNFNFSGHVYDLQVEPYQLYICNGVIVKNCRCTVVPELRDDYRDVYLADAQEPPRETFDEWAQLQGAGMLLALFLGA